MFYMWQKSNLHLFGEGIELITTDKKDLISQSVLNVQMFIRETLATYN